MKNGICKLCGTFGDLSFEHVPPRVTFNRNTRYKIYPFLKFVQSENIFEPNLKAKTEQGGVGFYSFCRKCNSFLGLTYVNAYSYYVNSFVDFAKKSDLNYFEFIMHDFEASKVLKQILSMFLAINPEEFYLSNQDIVEYILNPESTDLPSRFRLFTYLNTEGQLRNFPIGVVGNFTSPSMVLASEIAYPPLGYVLTIDFNGEVQYLHEITNFKEIPSSQKKTFDFKIYRLPTFSPFLLDYRSKEVMIEQRNDISQR